MATLTIADLDNGKRDLKTVDSVANNHDDHTTTRYGDQVLTLAGAIRRLGYQSPVAYAAGLSVDSSVFTVEYNGVIYAPNPSMVPFNTGSWNPGQWRPVQNTANTNQVYQFDSEAHANSEASTLPDGVAVIVDGISQGHVEGGIYIPSAGVPPVTLKDYTELRDYSFPAKIVDVISPGIAGRFYVDDSAIENGGTQIVGIKKWRRLYSGNVMASWFGADPSGVADSTTSIGRAIDEGISLGRTVFIPSGEYKFDGYTCTKTDSFKVSIEGDSGNLPVLRPSQAAVNTGNYMFLFPSLRYSQVTGLSIVAEIKPGQLNIEMASVAGLEVGMVIQISSDRLWYNGSRGVKYCGEIHVINSINTSTKTITVDDFTRDRYTPSQTLVIRAWRPNTVSIKNLRLEAPYPSSIVTSVGIQLQQSVNSVIENVHCKGFIYRCFSDNLSVKSRYNNISCTQDSSMPTATVGYGLANEGTLGLIIDGLRSVGQRRAFDSDGLEGTTEAAIARDWMVTNFNVSGGGAWFPATNVISYGLGMHGASENGIFCDGFISSVSNGINARGRNSTVSNVVFSGPMNNLIGLYEEGAGIKISGCVYDSFTYPNKMPDISLVDPLAGCVNFLSLGINTTTGIVNYDLPIIVENNVAKGVRGAFIMMYVPPSNQFIENLFVSNNQIEGLAGAGNTMQLLKMAGTGFVNNAILLNNYTKTITGDILLYDANLALGARKPSSPTVQTMVDGAHYVTIADDEVIRIPRVDRSGNRVLASVKVRNDTSYLMVIVPESVTATNVANKPANVVAIANGSSMTGTTGTDGNITFGLMSNGDLWIENRSGLARQMKIHIL